MLSISFNAIVPQNGSAKYKLECEACMNMNLLSILFTESLKAFQTVSLHACQKKSGFMCEWVNLNTMTNTMHF